MSTFLMRHGQWQRAAAKVGIKKVHGELIK